MRGITERRKRYVVVTARIDENGTMHPTAVTLWDGKTYVFDHVDPPRRQAARYVGGGGLCYKVRIGNVVTNLYYEDPAWFVEEKVFE